MGAVIANRYEIHDLLGTGGMGEVFRGLDTQTGQPVAIKRLKPEIVANDPDLVRRFEREGEALRKLNHPNMVKMLAAIEEDGQYYLVMEYVGGGSLEALMDDQTQLPIRRVLEIALDLADALTRAHRLKIVHRDIKPANVLLAEDGTPRLTDFGVARMEEGTRVTQTGAMIGTYAYLSPEGCNGEEVDERSDIWSFGVMLYEMLTGHRPFDGQSPAATLTAIMTKPVPDMRAMRPDVPPALVSLITRMLEKERDQRVSSVRHVGSELEGMIRGVETPRIASSAPKASPTPHQSRFATPTPTERVTLAAVPRKLAIVPVLAILALVVVVTVLFLTLNNPGAQTTASLPTIEPVAPNEYMVLVAEIEHLGGEERDVTRFIMDDLVQTLEVEVPFSNTRIRRYPQVITSAEQAQAAAEQSGAPVIVWGHYDADGVQVEVQVGSTVAFPDMEFARELLERTANVRVRLTDERQQSLAQSIMLVLVSLQAADGDMYQTMLNSAVFEELDAPNAEIMGSSVAAHLHRSIRATLVDDNETANAEMDAAIALDGGNPLLYIFRGIAYVRQGDLNAALRQSETAQRLAPEGWPIPLYFLAASAGITNLEEVTERYAAITALETRDWFAWTLSGTGSYLLGGFEAARTNYEQAIALEPESNLPYLFAVPVALRRGDIPTAIAYSQTMVRDFPDPTLGGRVLGAAMGEQIGSTMAQYLSITGSMALGQYDNVVAHSDVYLATMSPTNPLFQAMALIPGTDMELMTGIVSRFAADVTVMYGLAKCNLHDFPAAEAAYTDGIAADADYTLLYLLRAEARLRQGNDAGGEEDLAAIEQSALADTFAPYVAALRAGDLDCTNLLSTSNPVLAAES